MIAYMYVCVLTWDEKLSVEKKEIQAHAIEDKAQCMCHRNLLYT